MRRKYTITIKTRWTPSDVAAEHIASELYKLAEASHLTREELNITWEELPDETLEEAMERVRRADTRKAKTGARRQ